MTCQVLVWTELYFMELCSNSEVLFNYKKRDLRIFFYFIDRKHLWGTLLCEKWFACDSLEKWRSETFAEGVPNCWCHPGALETEEFCQTNASMDNCIGSTGTSNVSAWCDSSKSEQIMQ